MRKTNTGFTLVELVVVVAIIAILAAVAIPVYSAYIEISIEATDLANIRPLYDEVVAEAIYSGKDVTDTEYDDGKLTKVSLRQKTDGWQSASIPDSLGEIGVLDGTPTAGGSAWVTFSYSANIATIHFRGGSGGDSGSGSGSGSVPALPVTADMSWEKFQRGAVIQDETGTCVIMTMIWDSWLAYSGGMKVADLAETYDNVVLVDASDIKDSSFTGTLQEGDLYYDSASDTYYYVTLVSLYESWPNSAWVPLLK